jgi:hypothetical protein
MNKTIKIRFVRLAWEPIGIVGEAEYVRSPDVPIEHLLEQAFARFNRGSGEEVEFDGPSASVGDVFVVSTAEDEPITSYKIAGIGYEKMRPY